MRTSIISASIAVSLGALTATATYASDKPAHLLTQVQQNISRPLTVAEFRDCDLQYSSCRVPCEKYQGREAAKNCYDACLSQLRACRR